MRIRKEFDLLYDKKKKLFNVFEYSEDTLKAFELDKESVNYMKMLVKTYSAERKISFGKLILNNLDNCLVVKMDTYPLPGFVTSKFKPVVNVFPINATLLSDYTPADVFACFSYSIILSQYMLNKSFNIRLEDQVSLFMDSCFMGMFGKKSGLIGSYRHLIPKMKFLVAMYVHKGLFGEDLTTEFMNNTASKYFLNYNDINLDFDFSSIVGLIRSLNNNKVISISENLFSTSVINYGGINSLPMYEDLSRMFATMLMVLVRGNHLFSTYWHKKTKNIYEKMVTFGVGYLGK
jgi:hypothetical protein